MRRYGGVREDGGTRDLLERVEVVGVGRVGVAERGAVGVAAGSARVLVTGVALRAMRMGMFVRVGPVFVRREEIAYGQMLRVGVRVHVAVARMPVHELEPARKAGRGHEGDGDEPGGEVSGSGHPRRRGVPWGWLSGLPRRASAG
jgi:hypothetical protein